MFQMLDRIDKRLRTRIEDVAKTASKCGERGIVDWAVRAANDAVALGRIRDKDLRTLERLEGTFADEFYRNSNGGTPSVFA
jgi:hypothetical protein